ncbi:MAG: acetyl-CoA synthetase [Ignavibacteriota bacterium]|nr:MAG: acetyl-CoA synthetase [Chlorobiota bacterium]MBE7476673.1 acetate--CoA ligase family protein [Ignavibacteriales bacterium]MBL1122075.1 acetyl-CoA synthetase [Ignavibacteriota bacterium]MCE7857712.1 acetyl-CoA synthetase [Ignavibacteria bacterium CHB3]GJQ43078.1 MAG: CoA-binding protein [Ignavibacteriaceae bacterium]
MTAVFNDYFYPKSICVVGASSKPKSLGYELTKSIKQYGYTGKLFLINPKSDEILGYKCYPTIESVKEKIDLAIIMVPKQFVEESIKQLTDKGTKAMILITAGFKETGKQGEQEEKRILELVKKSDARIVGPNCMGIINTIHEIKMNATFVAEEPQNGKMAFCSQSGAIGAAVLNSLRETDIKFSQFISVGNKADVTENDLLEYWEKDKNVSVITYYLESFEAGEKFIKYFIDEKITKPVIILKGGRTSSGIKAASSHTGAMGSSDKVVDAVLHQFGIIRADDLNDMFNTAKGFEDFPMPKGNRIAVVTNAGGPAILTVDTLEKNNLTLAELSSETKLKLREIVHPQGSVNNPVDLLPGGIAEEFKQVNEILVEDKNVDAVISVFVEPIMVPAIPVIEGINEIVKYPFGKNVKPIFQVVMPLPEFWDQYRKESKTKRSLFKRSEDPAVVIGNMLKFKNKQDNKNRLIPVETNIEGLKFEAGKFLSQEEVIKISEHYNIPIVKTNLMSLNDLKRVDFKFPVVLKAVGEKIIHKSELKGVVLNIKDKNELIHIAESMIKSFNQKKLSIESFLIQPYIHTKFELLVGGFRDPSFGPMIMFGSGGKYVEFIEDTTIRSAYLSDYDIEEMINNTKIGKIIQGVRGEIPADMNRIKSTIKSVAQMMLDHREIIECDLNPLVVTDDNNIFAVDIRIKC